MKENKKNTVAEKKKIIYYNRATPCKYVNKSFIIIVN